MQINLSGPTRILSIQNLFFLRPLYGALVENLAFTYDARADRMPMLKVSILRSAIPVPILEEDYSTK